MIDFVTADELRLKEYVHGEFMGYTEHAKQNSWPLPTAAEFADAAMRDLALVRQAIAGILSAGSVAPKENSAGQRKVTLTWPTTRR